MGASQHLPGVARSRRPVSRAGLWCGPHRLPRLALLAALACGPGAPAWAEEYLFPGVSGDGYSTDPRYTAVRIEARSTPPIYVFFDIDSKRRDMRIASLPRIWPPVPVKPVAFVRVEHALARNREHAAQAALGLISDAPGAWQAGGGLAFSQHSHGTEWSAGLRVRVLW